MDVFVFRPALASFVLDLNCISSIGSYAVRPCRSMSWQGYTQSSCLVVDCTYVSLHVRFNSCSVIRGRVKQRVRHYWLSAVWSRGWHSCHGCMFSAISFLYDPLSRSRMCSVCASERELQFLYLLCWILFVLFHWIVCISPVSIHELTRLHSLVVLWSTTLMWHSMSTASSGA